MRQKIGLTEKRHLATNSLYFSTRELVREYIDINITGLQFAIEGTVPTLARIVIVAIKNNLSPAVVDLKLDNLYIIAQAVRQWAEAIVFSIIVRREGVGKSRELDR